MDDACFLEVAVSAFIEVEGKQPFSKKWLPLKTIVPQDVREMVTFFTVSIHGIFDVLMLGKYNTIWHLHKKDY